MQSKTQAKAQIKTMTMTATKVVIGLVALVGAGACGSSGGGGNGSGGNNGGGVGGSTAGTGGATGGQGTGGTTGGGTGGTTGGGTGGRAATGGTTGGTASGGATGATDAGTDAARPDAGGNGTDAPVTPTDAGVSPNMSFFVTSEISATGNLGGLVMADAKCARLAAAAGVTGKTWKAYLSTAAENARTRIGTGPWFNIHGVMIAASIAQLHEEGGMTNNITQNTALTDQGLIVPGRNVRPAGSANEHDILTGSLTNGMVNTGFTCGAWDSATGSSYVGHVDRSGTQADPVVAASWNSAHSSQCADTLPGGGHGRLYCFATN